MDYTDTQDRLQHERIAASLKDFNVFNIEFTKADGTVRKLRGTVKIDLVPAEKHPKGTGTAPSNPFVLKVFDLDINDWRSVDTRRVSFIYIQDSDESRRETIFAELSEK